MKRTICPVHLMPDCSPMLNGCSRVIAANRSAERERLMAEQERLLREGVPIEDLVKLDDLGDHSTTGDPAPKVTTPPTGRPSHRVFVQDCQEAVDHARDVSITVLTSDEIIHVCAAVSIGYDLLATD